MALLHLLLVTGVLLLQVSSCAAFYAPLVKLLHTRQSSYVSRPHSLRKVAIFEDPSVLHSAIGVKGSLSLSSDDADLSAALSKIITSAKAAGISPLSAVFFVSSAYETASFDYQEVLCSLKGHFPSISGVIGATTGCAVGPLSVGQSPTELEGKSGINILFLDQALDLSMSTLLMDDEAVAKFVSEDFVEEQGIQSFNSGLAILLATDSVKPRLSRLMQRLYVKERVSSVSGAMASAITMLQTPKIFVSNVDCTHLTRLSNGIVGLVLKGDLTAHHYVAQSASSVGPAFRVISRDRNTVLQLESTEERDGISIDEVKSPLEFLESVLRCISAEDAMALKRELLISITPLPPTEVTNGRQQVSFSQKPTAFDPLTGSVTLPFLHDMIGDENVDYLWHFCVRNNAVAKRELDNTMQRVLLDEKEYQFSSASDAALPALFFGSAERGVRVFRMQHWESTQLYNRLQGGSRDALKQESPVVSGMYSNGAFFYAGSSRAAITETDSVYSIWRRPSRVASSPAEKIIIGDANPTKSDYVATMDLLQSDDRLRHSDRDDLLLVRKRDPASAHPVKVGSMDFSVPSALPQPQNVLESLVWDREKDIDRQRERYATNRALLMAKSADKTFGPSRDLRTRLRHLQQLRSFSSSIKEPILLLDLLKTSLHNGVHPHFAYLQQQQQIVGRELLAAEQAPTTSSLAANSDTALAERFFMTQLAALDGADAQTVDTAQLLGVGIHTDSSTYQGSFEDVESMKKWSKTQPGLSHVPVVCRDFVLFAYQLFRAKAAGADVVTFLAGALTMADLAYLVKTATALGMQSIVSVASVSQFLAVLREVPLCDFLSVTSRNWRLWKGDEGKAASILRDVKVQEALQARRIQDQLAGSGKDLVVLMEGFTSPAELQEATALGVEAVWMGEELLHTLASSQEQDMTSWDAAKQWLKLSSV